ncbi:MAG: trypsin-like peptidase domain-containing protein [Anaerolineales bacterium]|nr:trypsin-like peptidase domain-containing protein [Anaerolineales bacterium]MCW5855273.1 trypsin-like peptidase domain-containing protein [Anaerolineales bacterium]
MKKTVRPILLLLGLLVLTSLACRLPISELSALLPQSGAPAAEAEAPSLLATAAIPVSIEMLDQQEALVSLYQAVSPGVVSIATLSDLGSGQGSGFVYDTQGHIVTNYHVIQGASYLEVAFPSGLKAVGRVIGEDRDSDLAVIKVDVDAAELHPLAVGDSDALLVGQSVIAIGNPFGLQGSMSTGIVSSLGRSMESMNQAAEGGVYSAGDLIQTDAAINPGNSGGPLLNLQGEVVGINRAIRTYSSTQDGSALNSGIGFAISSSIVKRVVPSLISQGHFDYPYLGISSNSSLTLAEAEQLGINRTDGSLIARVTPGGPAAEAGVQAGDFIIAIDGLSIKSFDDLISYLFRQKSPGETVTLTVLRSGAELEIDLVLGSRPRQ